MVETGLIKHGWTYVNIDDTWQGQRGGKDHALQGNEKFPDLKKLCDEIHGMGLKAGTYSTPWVTSYANHPGGSAEDPDGKWEKFEGAKQVNKKCPAVRRGQILLRQTGREAIRRMGLRLSQIRLEPDRGAPGGGDGRRAEGEPAGTSCSAFPPCALRRGGRLGAWPTPGGPLGTSATTGRSVHVDRLFVRPRGRVSPGPGHWNDPDMLVVGKVGWGQAAPDRPDGRRAVHPHLAVVPAGRPAADRLRPDADGRLHPRPADERRGAGRGPGAARQAGTGAKD